MNSKIFHRVVISLSVVLLAGIILNVLTNCGVAGVPANFKPVGKLEHWSNADWQTVLDRSVTEDGYVKYPVLSENQQGTKDALMRYLGQLESASPENRPDLFPNEADRLAYWLNAYNACCMDGVLQKNLPDNVLLSGVFFFPNSFTLGGKGYSLDALEKEKVRTVGDPRVHFALNCMSKSCPPLRKEAYDGGKLDAQLSDQAHRYLSDNRGAVRDGDKVKLGGIFGFYTEDFIAAYEKKTGAKNATLLQAIQDFAPEKSPARDAVGYSIMGYDWGLNRAP